MRNVIKVAVFMAISGSSLAGDLVLKLGTTGNFRYHRVPITGNVTISPSSGDVTIDPVAEAGVLGDSWCPSGTPTQGAPTFSTGLAVNNSSLPAGGGSVTLTWATSSATTVTCTASSSGVSGWNSNTVNSPTTINLSASGNYSFFVNCQNSNGTTQSGTVSVAVASAPPTAVCPDRPQPSGITRLTSMQNYYSSQQNNEFSLGAQVQVSTYSPLLGTSFNHSNQAAHAYIETGKYVAMGFSTSGATLGATGGIAWVQSGVAPGVITVMISPCPGDFQWVTDGNCKTTSGEAQLTWKVGTKPATGAGFYCYLDPNQTYYINAVFSSEASGFATSSCSSGLPYCDWLISPVGGN